MSGKRAGIYAIGYVAGPPEHGVADDEWVDPSDRGKPLSFCLLRWSEVRVDHPMLKADLLAAGGLSKRGSSASRWPATRPSSATASGA